jgi:hypothetical protein
MKAHNFKNNTLILHMDNTLLHNVCKDVTREAYNDYKHYITNALFEVNDDLIDIELRHMKMTIGQKINKKYFIDTKYPKQYEIKESTVKNYVLIAVKYGNRFAKKYKIIKKD